MCTALPLDEIYPPTDFHNHSKYSFEDMHQTKFKYEGKQRAITQKISKQELQFMCTTLPFDEIYPPIKFHNHSLYSFGDMFWTKFKYENKQRAITQKLSKQELRFIAITSIVLEICSRKQVLQFMCSALPLDEFYPPTKFHNHS